MDHYIALIRKEPDTEYGVDFPDFPGCISAGDTLEEAFANAAEALAAHIEIMRDEGEAVPPPTATIEDVKADPHNNDAVAVLIAAAPEPARAVRVNISLDANLLGEIDRAAEAQRSNRSAFLADAARAALYSPRRSAKSKAAKSSRS
jgi:predicted RNase H-like HicB family nuclease